MKRFGLKAIAAALALTMLASLGVPATAKAEENKVLLTTAPKAGSVLEITQSMVDSEGELVLSGETFDKVVIPNDVEVKRLYVDGGKIGELTIESGNNPEIQIWDTQITNVTVVPSELIDLNAALTEYIDIVFASEDPNAFDISGFVNQIEGKNKALSTEAPKIVLKGADMESSTQKIENMNLCANAKLDCTEGKMPVALNVNLEGGKQDVKVTVKGYVGDMNLNQTSDADKAYGLMDVKLEESVMGTVTVAAAGNASVMLHSDDSVAETVKFTSNGETTLTKVLSLDMLAANLVTTAEANNADIRLISSVDNVEINGKSVDLNLGSHADVQTATIAGEDNVVEGLGRMNECKIADGCTATVLVMGANVEGKNNYVPSMSLPEIIIPGEGPVIELKPLYGDAAVMIDGNKASINGQYKSAYYTVPSDVDGSNLASIYVEADADQQIYIKIVGMDGKPITNDAGGSMEPWFGPDSTTLFVDIPEGRVVKQLEFMSLNGGTTNVEVFAVEFTEREGGAEDDGEAPVFNFAELTVGGYGYTSEVVEGAVEGTISDQYQEIQFSLPKFIDLSKYTKIIVEAECGKELDIKLKDSEGTTFQDAYSGGAITSPHTITLNAEARTKKLAMICFMAMVKGETTDFMVKSVTFE